MARTGGAHGGRALMRSGPIFPVMVAMALIAAAVGVHGAGSGLAEGAARSAQPRQLAQTPEQSPPPAPKDLRRKILVVDDNRDAADSLAMLLEMNGHGVYVGHSGSEALQLARRELPHAMILDIGMPDMSGYEVARRIRAERWGSQIYLIAVTGWGQKEDKDRAIAAGFDHHLTKPVDPDQVESLLQAFFRRRRELDESANR